MLCHCFLPQLLSPTIAFSHNLCCDLLGVAAVAYALNLMVDATLLSGMVGVHHQCEDVGENIDDPGTHELRRQESKVLLHITDQYGQRRINTDDIELPRLLKEGLELSKDGEIKMKPARISAIVPQNEVTAFDCQNTGELPSFHGFFFPVLDRSCIVDCQSCCQQLEGLRQHPWQKPNHAAYDQS